MNKVFLWILLFLFFPMMGNTQPVHNPELFTELSINQGLRAASLYNFEKSYGRMQDTYNEAKTDVTGILAVHEMMYQALYNVNSLFKQGKKIRIIKNYGERLTLSLVEVGQITIKYPQYAVWLNKHYQRLGEQLARIVEDIKVITKPTEKIIMDAYQRDMLLDNILHKLQMAEFSTLTIMNAIEYSKSRAYIYSIPKLGDWIEEDKRLTEEIIQKFEMLKNN